MYLGYIASILTTIAYLPQVINCFKTGDKGITLNTLIILLMGMILWLWYASLVGDKPLMVSSLVSLCQLLFLAIFSYVKNTQRRIKS
jgi:MtN3 and saliva related transmembrane protein